MVDLVESEELELIKTHFGSFGLKPQSKPRVEVLEAFTDVTNLVETFGLVESILRFSLYHMTRHNQLEVSNYLRKMYTCMYVCIVHFDLLKKHFTISYSSSTTLYYFKVTAFFLDTFCAEF